MLKDIVEETKAQLPKERVKTFMKPFPVKFTI
jgi:hypothetical protein